MCPSFLYRLAALIFALVIRKTNTTEDHLELLVLRHQVAVLSRDASKTRNFTWADRAIAALISCSLPRLRLKSLAIKPKTVLSWHRALVRRKWTYPHKVVGRPPLNKELRALIIRLASENPRWGSRRIEGELLNLGHRVSDTTIIRILKSQGVDPNKKDGPTWTEFLRQQGASMLACDFFTIETVNLKTLYAFFFIELTTRRVHFAGVTKHPTGEWVTEQVREFIDSVGGAANGFTHLIRDRDTKFIRAFDEAFAASGIQVIKTPVRSPKANAFAERFVGTARRECFHWLLVFGRRHCEHAFKEFIEHYNRARPHRGIDLKTPVASEPISQGKTRIVRRDRIGGLLHEYEGEAA